MRKLQPIAARKLPFLTSSLFGLRRFRRSAPVASCFHRRDRLVPEASEHETKWSTNEDLQTAQNLDNLGMGSVISAQQNSGPLRIAFRARVDVHRRTIVLQSLHDAPGFVGSRAIL